MPSRRGPLLRQATVTGRPVAGLADGGMQPQITDQVPRARKAADVADHRGEGHGGRRVDARDRHQAPDVGVAERILGDDPVDRPELVAEEVKLTQRRVERQALVERKLLSGQPCAALLAEQVRDRRSAFEIAVQHRRDLVLDLRPALDQPAAARDDATDRPRLLVADPHRRDQIGGQEIGQDLGIDLVGLDLRMADRPHMPRMREHDLADMRLEDPRDRQRVTGRFEHDPVGRPETLGEQLKRRRRGRHAPGRPRTATIGDRDLAEVAMHV